VCYVDEVSQSEVHESYGNVSNSVRMPVVYGYGVKMFEVCELSDKVSNVCKSSVSWMMTKSQVS
jgi:hypothetical protein